MTPSDDRDFVVLNFHRELEIGDYEDEVSPIVWVEIESLAVPHTAGRNPELHGYGGKSG